MAGPYAGLRGFDLGHVIAGPFCTPTLADPGADVVRVEQPAGDGRPAAPARVRRPLGAPPAHLLLSDLVARGIGPGDRVAVLGENGLEYVQLDFATAAPGAILVPLDSWHRSAEHAYAVRDAEPALLVAPRT
jgi:hypothetical protein